MSTDLSWMIIRNNNAYIKKKRDIKRPFSTEPGNLRNLNCLRSSGLVNKKAYHINADPSGKGVVFSFKTNKNQRKPGLNLIKTTIKTGPRKTLQKLKKFVRHNYYRKDLKMDLLRRASAILRSQKAVPYKNKRKVRKGSKPKVSKTAKSTKKSE